MEDTLRPRLEATRLLELVAEEHSATPVDQLAERLGLDVERFHSKTRRAGTLGWLEPGENLIFLREDLTEPVRRFTLAHEIGHFVLHRGPGRDGGPLYPPDLAAEPACDGSDLDAPLDALSASTETLRPGQAYSGRTRRESEANLFAAALLLPAQAVLAEYERVTTSRLPPGRRVRALAEHFGVTEDVLLRRLAALLLPEVDDSGGQQAGDENDTGGSALRSALDEWQRTAARSGTPALVVAGPGTGKTSTLVGRVAYLVTDVGASPRSILALTFSNKAAREMRERVQALLADASEDVRQSGSALPTIATIHAFCGDLLRRYAPLVGLRPDFRLVSETDGYFILRELASTLTLRRYSPLAAPAQHFPAILSAISRAKDELCDPERLMEVARGLRERADTDEERETAERAAEVAEVYAAYQAELTRRGDADFGDLVRLTVRLLTEHAEVLADVRSAYRHILVDEFQDINRAMGVLLRVLAGEDGPLWAVGDADQAIYRFRGASPANLSRFEQEYPGAQIHTLKRNYRSVPAILEAAAGVAATYLPGGQRDALAANRADDQAVLAVTLATAPNETAELAGLVETVGAMQSAGWALDEQVVLCRTRKHCQQVADALRAAQIPVHMVTPLLQQDAVKDVLAVLSVLADVSGAGLLRAGNLPDHSFSHVDARAVLTAAHERRLSVVALLLRDLDGVEDLTAAGRKGLRQLGAIVRELRRASGVGSGLARYTFGLTDLGRQLLADARSDDAAERARTASIAQLLTLARAFEDRQDADGRRPGAGADWNGFLDYIRVVAALRQEASGASDELMAGETGRVRVLTVHASKGLEFPVVYLPGLADRRFPSQRRGSIVSLPDAIFDDEVASAEAHLAEEACLFYVALTRARDALVLSYAEQYGRLRYRPSPFLQPLAAILGGRLAHARWEETTDRVAPPHTRMGDAGRVAFPPEQSQQEALRLVEIETYKRCPRQYAYRYIYGLRPSEVGLSTLRRTLHETLHALQVQFTGHDQAPPLDDVLAMFEQRWTEALARERFDTGDAEAGDERMARTAQEPFTELYRRHGRQVVERVWSRLAGAGEDASEQNHGERLSPVVAYEETVTVRVGGEEIVVTLDRVEHDRADTPVGARAGDNGRGGQIRSSELPARLVRHRLGHGGQAQADLRQLLYALAAEQGRSSPAELYSHNLTTGELERVTLDRRKLARLYDDLDQTLDGMRRRVYPPRPDPNTCQTCPFLLICPA